MNGNRIGEHRKPRVPATNWMVLVGIIAAIVALGAMNAKGQEYEPFNAGTGLLVQEAEMCFTPELNAESIKMLNTWHRLVNELESFERGGPAMHPEDAYLGQLLYDNDICHTVTEFYHVVILKRIEGYVLVKFNDGFDTRPFIVRAQDILPDRGI